MLARHAAEQNKPETLKKVMAEHGFDALIVSIRRDEHGIRAKERYVSPREQNSGGITRTSPPSSGTTIPQT